MTRSLRPLAWWGILEDRQEKRHSGRGFDEVFRKVPLFGQLAGFEVEIKGAEGRGTNVAVRSEADVNRLMRGCNA